VAVNSKITMKMTFYFLVTIMEKKKNSKMETGRNISDSIVTVLYIA